MTEQERIAELLQTLDIYDISIGDTDYIEYYGGKKYNNNNTHYPINFTISEASLSSSSSTAISDYIYNIIAMYPRYTKTIGIDYRLLNGDTVSALALLYSQGHINGIRILPRGTTLDTNIYNIINNQAVSILLDDNFIICADKVSVPNSRFDTRAQHNVCTIERIQRMNDNTYISDNIHINRELNDEELKQIVKISNTKCNKILFNKYKPSYYKNTLTKLKQYGLREDITLTFLANPLYDNIKEFDGLDKIVKNNINIHYNTCNDLNDLYGYSTSEGQEYYSDLEASGYCSLNEYIKMLKETTKIVDHINSMNYSDLEKVAYLYDYFKKNYIYDPDFQNTPHQLNSYLHNIVSRDKMVCEGFSNWFSCILRRSGIKCFTVGTQDHQYNILRIKDEKYNVNNIALLDITNDIGRTKGINNSFNYFLLPPDYFLYRQYYQSGYVKCDGTQLNIASSLYIPTEEYLKYLKDSNPGYVIEHFGYTRRMLELMGLEINVDAPTEDDIRSAYLNSGLGHDIPVSALMSAINNVRRREREFLQASNGDFYAQTHINRDHPIIKSNSGQEISVKLLRPDPTVEFSETDNITSLINPVTNPPASTTRPVTPNNNGQGTQGHTERPNGSQNGQKVPANNGSAARPITNPTPEPNITPALPVQAVVEESYARNPKMMELLKVLRNFNTSLMTKNNYKKGNKILNEIEAATNSDELGLDADDQFTMAQIRSMVEAYKSKSTLVQNLDACEALMNANTFNENAFKDCIKEFYNIVGHTSYAMDQTRSTAIRTATTRRLITRKDYTRFQKVFEYYKKWSILTAKDLFTENIINTENKKKR